MNPIAMQWAWKTTLPATQKFVLVAMADHASKEEAVCRPSLSFLSRKTGLSIRTIKEARRQLKNKGFIRRLCPGCYLLCCEKSLNEQKSCTFIKNLPCVIEEQESTDLNASAVSFYKNPLAKLQKVSQAGDHFPQQPKDKALSVKETIMLQSWRQHEKNQFKNLAFSRRTNPEEARNAMLSLVKNLTPDLLKIIEKDRDEP